MTEFYRRMLPHLNHHGHFLLGDAIFASSSVMLTVYDYSSVARRTRAQRLLQWAMVRTRSVVERAFGIMKRRFPWLADMRVATSANAIQWLKCAIVLHNIDRFSFAERNAPPWNERDSVPMDPSAAIEAASRDAYRGNGDVWNPCTPVAPLAAEEDMEVVLRGTHGAFGGPAAAESRWRDLIKALGFDLEPE